jgi:hypothetical protein
MYLSAVEQQLSPKERQEIESRLANYHIPLQILHMIAEECNCVEAITGMRETRGKSKDPSLISRLNDQALVQLRQTFLDCKDSFSRFRFAVLLSSKFSPSSFKFVMEKKIQGSSGHEHVFDVCIFSRATEDLVAVGMQNNDAQKRPADAKLLHQYLDTIGDVATAHPKLRSAYYVSSYGYGCGPSRLAAKTQSGKNSTVEMNFLEFHDRVYRPVKEQ